MDIVAGMVESARPLAIVLAFAIQLALPLYIAGVMARSRPAYKNVLYAGALALSALSMYPYFHYAYSGEAITFYLRALISVPLIFFLPGHLAYKAFIKENTDLGPVEVAFLQVMGSVLLGGWIGLALAEVGLFSLASLDAVLLIICCALMVKYRLKPGPGIIPAILPDKGTLFLFAILALCVALFFHPYPWILGNLDQGTYVNTGVNIAKTGSIVIHDKIGEDVNSGLIGKVFYVFYNGHGVQFPGFYLPGGEPGTVVPQFFYLWPTWIAIFYSIFGLAIGLYVTPVFGLLAVLGIYLAGKILFNKNVGLVAALLLSVNFAQIWYSREPMSEVPTLLLIFTGIALFALFMRRPEQRYIGVLSALCVGQVFLTRIDTVFLVVPFIAYLGGLWFYGKFKKDHWYFIIPLVLVIAHAVATAILISRPYTASIYRNDFDILSGLQAYAVLAVLAIVFILLAAIVKYKDMLAARARALERYALYIKPAAALLILAGVLFAYFIRPSGDVYSDSYNLVKLSWYMAGLFGVLFATAGFILIMYKKPFNEAFIFASVFLIYAVFYLDSSKINGWQPWWIRRYLPIVIPGAILCIAYLVDWIKGLDIRIPKVRIGASGYIAALLVLFLVSSFAVPDYKILDFTQYRHAMEDVDNLDKLTGDSIILYRSNQFTEMVAVPLRYVYGRDVASVHITDQSIGQIREWLEENRSVCLLGFDGFGENGGGDGHVAGYTVNWTVLQDARWGGRLNVFIPGGPRADHFTYTLRFLNTTGDLDGLAIMSLDDGDWSEIEAWGKTPTVWGDNNASLDIFSTGNRSMNLTFLAKSPDGDKKLQVCLDGDIVSERNITADYCPVAIPIELKDGDNVVVFQVPSGDPDNESRCFACQDLALRDQVPG